ncbi:MAG TPA: SGNH/GDSL hydrolase family protein [Gammaproteobacteria bacterium]|nr:SGNH/GDSL hydrolase family protein [Gammaproteobacteria bacterium]
MTRQNLMFYLLGTLITLTGFFAVIELTTRTVSWARGNGFGLALHELDATDNAISDIYQFHPFAGFVFKPRRLHLGGHPAQEEKAIVRTDEHGFLSEADFLPIAKGANEIRIATIGASTTANINLSYADNWPGRLGEFVQQVLPDNKVTVINAGVPGFNTAQSIGNLALRVMPFKPDVVIVYHAYNDLKVVRPDFEVLPDYSNFHTRPFGEHERPSVFINALNTSMFYVRARNSYRAYKDATAINDLIAGTNRLSRVPDRAAAVFEHNIRMLVACAVGGGARVVLSSFATLHALDEDYESNALTAELTPREHKELVAIMRFTPGLTLKGIFDGIARYNEVLEAVSKELNTGWVDNAKLVAHSDENFIDRVHFTRAGADRMARNFLPATLRQLRGGATESANSVAE